MGDRRLPHLLDRVASIVDPLEALSVLGHGSLELMDADGLDARDRRLGQAFADAATIGILHERSVADRDALNTQLQGALDSRVAIEQAKGVVAERRGVGMDEAFALIRAYARSHSTGLSRVALAIVAGELDAAALAPGGAAD